MAYLDVLPLADVRTYLRVDDTQNETDSEITSMIKSALRYIENHTHIMLYARDKDFNVLNGCVRVYDHPINSIVTPTDAVAQVKTLHTNYTVDADTETLTLNVGYSDPADVPTDLIDLAKVIIKVMYYEQESNQSFKEMLPGWAKELLNSNKRYIV